MLFLKYEKHRKGQKTVISLGKIIIKQNFFQMKIRASDSPLKTSFRYIFFEKKSLDRQVERNNIHFSLRDDVMTHRKSTVVPKNTSVTILLTNFVYINVCRYLG